MLEIESLEDTVYKRATLVSQDCGNSMVESLLALMRQNATSSRASKAERRARLSARINGIHTQDTFESAVQYHHSGTCSWVVELNEFRQWTAADTECSQLLWLHGPPGFGKTILSAWVVQYLKKTSSGPAAYFFCVADNERTRDPFAILRSWLLQIIEIEDRAIDAMEAFLSSLKGQDILTNAELWEALVVLCQACPKCVFLLDGFDECTNVAASAHYHTDDSRSYFLQDLKRSLARVNDARALVVSRDIADIRAYLGRDISHEEEGVHMLEYQITAKDTEADVALFSAHVVNQKLPRKSPEIRKQIASEAANRSKGMFLWIQLLEKEISPRQNAKQLRATVRDMPSGISEAYARELEKIHLLPGDDRSIAIMILRWVLFAVRPLQVKGLAEALIVSDRNLEAYPRDELPDEWEVGFVDEDYVNATILGLCGSLLRLRSRSPREPLCDSTVHFVHFSVKEYLTSDGEENAWASRLGIGNGRTEAEFLSQVCLRYVTLDVFREIPTETRLFPLLSYASWAWYFHSFHQKPQPRPEVISSTKRAFDPATPSWKVWTRVLERTLVEARRERSIVASEEQESSLGGEEEDALSENSVSDPGSDVAHTDSSSARDVFTALQATDIAREPLKLEGDIHVENPIYYASLLGLTGIVTWLAEQGLQVSCAGGHFGFPLQAAAARGHDEVVAYLVNRKAPVNQTGGKFYTALLAAAACARLETVKILLDAGADSSLREEDGLTAVEHAARRGAPDILKMLLENGAQSTAAAKRWAVSSNHRDSLRLLQAGDGETLDVLHDSRDVRVLDEAIRYSHFDIVIDVIEALPAPAITAQLKDGSVLLHNAAAYGALPVVHTLLHHPDPSRRSDVNQLDSSGWSALHHACSQGAGDVVRVLLDASAQVNHEGLQTSSTTVLQVAASYGDCDIIRTLHRAGARLDQKTHGNVTALWVAVAEGQTAAVGALLELGAGMRCIDEASQWTLFSTAHEQSEHEICDLLMSHGCFGGLGDQDQAIKKQTPRVSACPYSSRNQTRRWERSSSGV